MRDTFAVLACLVVAVCGSGNGNFYKCDEQKLQDDNVCIFTRSDKLSTPWFTTAVPHNLDRSVGVEYHRKIYSTETGKVVDASPTPWTNEDKLVYSATAVGAGADWNYVLAFEMLAPLRDYAMYNPSALTADPALWARLTRVLVDCGVKAVDEASNYSVDQVYGFLSDPAGKDIHNIVLRFLEEGSIDLACLMTGGISGGGKIMDRCYDISESQGIEVTTISDCWVPAYEAMYPNQTSASATGDGVDVVVTSSTGDGVDLVVPTSSSRPQMEVHMFALFSAVVFASVFQAFC